MMHVIKLFFLFESVNFELTL